MITLEQIKQFRAICNLILSIETKPGSMLNYAKSYAQAGLTITSPEGIYSQLLYISSNISTWRGEEARTTKKEIKTLIKQLKKRR